jgi:hypothetical protein
MQQGVDTQHAGARLNSNAFSNAFQNESPKEISRPASRSVVSWQKKARASKLMCVFKSLLPSGKKQI